MRISELHDELCAALKLAGATAPEPLMPANYDGKRADAIFQAERAIVEVKSVCNDRFDAEGIEQKVEAVITKWIAKGSVPIFGTATVRVDELPYVVQRDVFAIFGSRIASGLGPRGGRDRKIRE